MALTQREREFTQATGQDATDVDLLRMLASALHEGLPEAMGYIVDPHEFKLRVNIHLRTAEHCDHWQQWWIRHGGDAWKPMESEPQGSPYVHHKLVGQWRGWVVELVHLTRSGGDAR